MSPRALLLFALLLSALAVAIPTASAAHAPLHVNGDAGFAQSGWLGSGTALDPYRVPAGTSAIQATNGYGLRIENTDAHVNLSGFSVTGGGTRSDGIQLQNVRNVSIYDVVLESNRLGISLRDSSSIEIQASTVKTSQVGIFLENVRGAAIRDNRLSVNDKNVEFRTSTRNTLTSNNLSVATGQYGLFLNDNTSYDNSVGPSNVVNAIPIRWYAGLVGTQSAPIVIADITVDLPRMTNVAQILVTNSSYVRIERATAKAGVSAGFHIHASDAIELVAPIADGNAGQGIFVERSDRTRISNGSLRNNLAAGALLRSTFDSIVEFAAIADNTQQGISVAAGTNATTLRNLTIGGNAGGGISADGARNLTLVSSQLTSNGATEVTLANARDANVSANTIAGTGTTGIRIQSTNARVSANVISGHTAGIAFVSSTGSNLTHNALTLVASGFGLSFDGAGSYNNRIDESNTVNGTSIRWITDQLGPLTLSALRVELRGITNVAQIMVYRSSNITLDAPIALNGTAAGILLYDARDGNVSAATIRANTGPGIQATSSADLKVLASKISQNGGDGIRIQTSSGAVVENNVVEGNYGRGIAAEASDRPTFRGNAMTANGGAGLQLASIGPGGAAADHNSVLANRGGGIVATSSVVGSLFANTLRDNGGDGISLATVPVGARIDANTVSNHTRGISLASASGTDLLGNTLSIATGQTGIHFADETSYNVSLMTSNTVNGVPVRWYVGANNSTIQDARVELPGITNVAQIMLYRASNVTLTGAVASNGTSRGLFIFASGDILVERALAENNSRAGIQVETSRAARVNASASRLNVQEGALVHLSPGAWLSNSTFERNGFAGVSVGASLGVGGRIEGLVVTANKGGVLVEGSNVSRIHGNDVRSNGATGILLSASPVGNVTNNSVIDHLRNFELANAGGITFEGNDIAKLANQTGWHFTSITSYDNTIGPSNVVNGVPMRWYSRTASLDLTGVRVELQGITNVAQVMLYKTTGATLQDARVANGTAHGIYVFSADTATINGSVSENNTGHGILVEDSLSIALRNFTSERNTGAGARFVKGSGHTLDNATLASNTGVGAEGSETTSWNVLRSIIHANVGGGVKIDRVSTPRILGSNASDNGPFGILILASPSMNATGNRVANHTKAFELRDTEFGEFHTNEITIRDGQTGLHFADERSYNNNIPTTNLVNGQPVHWYVALAGTEANPVTISDVRSEQRGVTNVAQVMVYRSAYAVLPGVIATNGTASGIVVQRSSSLVLDGANASGNNVAGVHLLSTQSTSVRDLRTQGGQSAVLLTDSANNVISRVNASGAALGVSLTSAASRDNRIDQIEVNGTTRGVADAGWKGAGIQGNNLIVEAGVSKRGKIGANVSFGDAMTTYRLEASRIVNQTFSFGDGSPNVSSTASTLLRPFHGYASAGIYIANLTARTADGLTLMDSVHVEIVPPLSEPRSLVATGGARNVTLGWIAPASDGAAVISAYRIYRGTNETNFAFVTQVSGGIRAFVDTDLVNGRSYLYRVAAQNADGDGPNASASAIPVGAPGAPTKVVAKEGARAVTLNWSAPVDTGGVPIGGYSVMRIVNGTSLGSVSTVGNVTGATVTGLTNGLAYTFAVRAFNSVGAGVLSSEVTATPVGPAGPVRELRALPGDASVTLVWAAPSDDGGTKITSYRILRSGVNDSLSLLPAVIASNVTTHRDTGLSNGQSYQYVIIAINAVGNGERAPLVASIPTAVDALRPIVFDKRPSGGALLTESPVSVGAQYTDNDGVVLDSVRVYFDGSQVGANVTTEAFTYVVPVVLDRGEHTVRVVLRDPSGNEANESWTFRIIPEEERVPRFEVTNRSFVPGTVAPGGNVTARATVRNVGFAAGDLTLSVHLDGNLLGYAELALDEGQTDDLFVEFSAPTVAGVYNLTLGEANLTLVVTSPENSTAAGALNDSSSQSPSPNKDDDPTRPARGTPPPRVAGGSKTPFPGPVLLLVLVSLLAWMRRKP